MLNTKKNMEEKHLIICQAPFHVQYVLTIVNLLAERNVKNDVLVVNVEEVFTYLTQLNLGSTNLFFYKDTIELSGVPGLLSLRKNKSNIEEFFCEKISSAAYSHVSYFTNVYDWMTGYFVASLSRTAKMVFYEVEVHDVINRKIGEPSSFSMKKYVQVLAMRYVTGVEFCFRSLGNGSNPYFFPYESYSIERSSIQVKAEVLKKYVFKYTGPKKSILIVEAKVAFYFQNYEEEITRVLSMVRDTGYNIVLKTHPRIGAENFIYNLVDDEITSSMPSELIDASCFSMVIGSISTGLTSLQGSDGVPIISLIEMIDLVDENDRTRILSVLGTNKLQTILFPVSLQEIKDYLL